MIYELFSYIRGLVTRFTSRPGVRVAEHVICGIALYYAFNYLRKHGLSELNIVGKLTSVVPGASSFLNARLENEVKDALSKLFPRTEQKERVEIPDQGVPAKELLASMKKLRDQVDAQPGEGKIFSLSYDSDDSAHQPLLDGAMNMFAHENALNPMAYPSLRKFEVEVVRMTIDMLNGDNKAVGTMTSGGTESILCAIKAYRQRARHLFPHITKPEMVMPRTAHVAFPKAAHLFDVKIVWVDTDPVTTQPIMEEYRRAITKNTILLVGSAPQYPSGQIDPIREIGELAREFKLPLHVDACFGGFVLPWIEKLGVKLPIWDFRDPNVTSISADVHKYGYATKGASVISYRNAELRKYQFFAFTQWPGGIFVSPSLLGSRNGGCIAAAWASLVFTGKQGYLARTRKILSVAKYLRAKIPEIGGGGVLEVQGDQVTSVVTFKLTDKAPSDLSILVVADVMEKRFGWKMERQQKPASLHLTLMPIHDKSKEAFVRNLAEAVKIAARSPEMKGEGNAAMYGMIAKVGNTDRKMLETFLVKLMGGIYNDQTPEAQQESKSQ